MQYASSRFRPTTATPERKVASNMLTVAQVWEGLIGEPSQLPESAGQHPIHEVTVDSRAAGPEALFVALRGEKTDGHLYLREAFERGAVAAIAEPRVLEQSLNATVILPDGTVRAVGEVKTTGEGEDGAIGAPYVFVVPDSLAGLQNLAAFWRTQMPAAAVAITGSVGKTTTREIVANVLRQRYEVLESTGNLNNEIGLPLVLLRLTAEYQRVVLEMGMYALGEIARLCELARPRIGVVTNVGPTHLERLGSIERIAEAKSELVQALPAASEGGVAVLNADDPRVRAMAGVTRARVFTYGLNEASDLWADDITSEGLDGIHFRLHYGSEAFHLKLPILGRHSVHTALASAGVGLMDGLSWTEIIAGLQKTRGQLRLMVVPGIRDTTLIDDTYNASPVSMLAALNLLQDVTGRDKRSIAVLGDMLELGAYEEEGHRLVGGRAGQVVSKLITVGSRARWIAEEALATHLTQADVHPTENNTDAVAVLQGLIQPGDVVLIKGSRSMAMEAIVDALSNRRETGH